MSEKTILFSISFLFPKKKVNIFILAATFNAIFNRIKNTNCQNVINLFTYYEKTWINNSNWSLNEITQWRNHIRTNNDAERFHMKLMNSVKKCNVDFYELVNILGEIGNVIPLTAKMLGQGMLESTKRKRQKNFETELANASNELCEKKITPIQFLNILTESNHDNQLVNHDWGVVNSRIDVMPEDESDTEDDEDTNESE